MIKEEFLWVASFDIGYRNFSFCIEEYNIDEISQIQKIDNQYNNDGTATEEQSEILKSICKNSSTVIFKNTDLTKGNEGIEWKWLDENKTHWCFIDEQGREYPCCEFSYDPDGIDVE